MAKQIAMQIIGWFVSFLGFLNSVMLFCFLSKPYIIIFGVLIMQIQVVGKNHRLLLLL